MNNLAVLKVSHMRTVGSPAFDSIKQPANLRGAEILIRSLIQNGVDTVFGLPGGAVLHIYDEIWRYRDQINHYLVRHEPGAVHAARIAPRQRKSRRRAGYVGTRSDQRGNGIATALWIRFRSLSSRDKFRPA